MYTRSQSSNVPTAQQHTSQDTHRLDITEPTRHFET